MDNQSNQPILLLVTSQDWGGVQSYLLDLAKELKNRGESVIICAGASKVRRTMYDVRSTNIGNELEKKCLENGIDFIELRRMSRNINPLSNLLALFELIGLFRRLKPRAVHLNSTMMGVVGSLAATITRVPKTIYCIGGWVFNEDLPAWKKNLYVWIEKISARWKDIITVVHPGDEALARSLKIQPRRQLLTIPNGIDVEKYEKQLLSKQEARAKLQIDPETFIVGTVANAYPPKNLLWYLEVCKQIHEKNPKIFFTIIGDGPQFEALKNKRDDLGQQSYVLLAGRRMDAASLYKAFDIFVLPSSKEGMPITILEAMAARLPIIATDVGACRWMLQPNAGLIVPPKDANALTGAILALRDDPNQQADLAAQSYQSVKTRFSWKTTAEKTIKLFNQPSLSEGEGDRAAIG